MSPPELAEHLRKPLENVSMVLMPVFFIITGLGADISGLGGRRVRGALAIITVACAGKLVGAIAPARAFGLSWTEARALGC